MNGRKSPIAQAISAYQDPPKKRATVNPVLKQQGVTQGLADTLSAILNRPLPLDTLPDKLKEPGLYGVYPPGSSTPFVRGDMPVDMTRETAIHEVGHMAREKNSIPWGIGYGGELAAQAFMRAYLALQATRSDTTNAEGVIEQFGRGIHPSLSRFERDKPRMNSDMTKRTLAELLSLPIFAQHPLRSRLPQFQRETGAQNATRSK